MNSDNSASKTRDVAQSINAPTENGILYIPRRVLKNEVLLLLRPSVFTDLYRVILAQHTVQDLDDHPLCHPRSRRYVAVSNGLERHGIEAQARAVI
jgi:hypothetical protein